MLVAVICFTAWMALNPLPSTTIAIKKNGSSTVKFHAIFLHYTEGDLAWVTKDSYGYDVVAGAIPIQNGKAVFMLNQGEEYYIWSTCTAGPAHMRTM